LTLEDGPMDSPKRQFQTTLRRVVTQKTEEFNLWFDVPYAEYLYVDGKEEKRNK
jgi:hypothetical protein